MARIPVICDNPSCLTIFPSIFNLGPDSKNVGIYSVGFGPCPKCGGTGHIPDGEYNSIAGVLIAELRNQSDVSALLELKAYLEQAISDKNFKKAKVEMQAKLPSWRNVFNLLPEENIANAMSVYTFLLALISLLLTNFPDSDQTDANIDIDVNVYIEQAFNNVYHPSQEPNHDNNTQEGHKPKKGKP